MAAALAEGFILGDGGQVQGEDMPTRVVRPDLVCETCNKVTASYGVPTEQKRRWCRNCSKSHDSALLLARNGSGKAKPAAVAASPAAAAEQRKGKRKLDSGELKPLSSFPGILEEQTGRDAVWEAHLAKLVEYKAEHGAFNVPQGWAEDPPLANWVNKQRANKKMLDRGDPSHGMTAARVARLTALGFVWDRSRSATSAEQKRSPPKKKRQKLEPKIKSKANRDHKVKFTGLTQNSQVDPAV